MKKNIFRSVPFLFVFVLLLGVVGNIIAQTQSFQVSIDRVLYNRFPTLDIYVSVLDVQGFPITELNKDAFTVTEDGNVINDFTVSSYKNTEEILALVLAIDISGSMDNPNKPTPLDNAVEAAKDFVAKLSPQDQIAVITFADEVAVLNELTSDKSTIPAALDALEPKGATAMNDAIVEAIDILINRSERRAIILLTDGKPEGEQLFTFDQAFSHASNSKIPIYPIGFGAVDENQLKRLAEVTGGMMQYKPDSQELTSAFDAILSIFREQYYLEIISGIEPDDLEHDLVVSLDFQGGTQKDTSKFTARKPVILSIDSPEEGDTLNGTVKIAVSIDALNAVAKVEFFIDEDSLQTVLTPPYEIDWDTTEFVTGEHTLKVVAIDQLGFRDEITINILVELQRQDWIYWLIGLVALVALAVFVSLGLRKRTTMPKSARKAVLVEVDGLRPGQEWPLDKSTIKLGRKQADNDIGLKGTKASRSHAVIERTQKGYVIYSLKPENPLNINGQPTDRHTLGTGDVIQLGDSIFRFEYEG